MAGENDNPQKLTGPQKAAIFLLKMGKEYTSEIFKKMNDEQLKVVAESMTKIDQIPPEVMESVLEEFVNNFEDENRLIVKGETFLKNVIESTLDTDRAKSIINGLENDKRDPPFVWSRDVDISTLAAYIMGEHPQTIAMILAYLPSEIASDILVFMPDEKKADIAVRIARLGKVPEEIIRDVDNVLRAEFKDMGKSGAEAGGLQALVNILNKVDKSTEDTIMETIEEDYADMAESIRGMMFVFEDLSNIDDLAMREILKKVESQQLVLSMKTASETMKQKILGNLSSRASEMLLEDFEAMGPVRLSEVETAQKAVLQAAKELEAEGIITLGGKGKEDVLV